MNASRKTDPTVTYALLDSNALVEIAREAGVTLAQARAICAALGELDPRQLVRIVAAAHRQERCARETICRRPSR